MNSNSAAILWALCVTIATANHVCPPPCGLGSGEDICSGGPQGPRCTPLVVRPMDLPAPANPLPLPPLPGPCACTAALVKPAVVPKPVCTVCQGHSVAQQQQVVCTTNTHAHCSSSSSVLGGCAKPLIIDNGMGSNPQNPANYIPADPISLSLAYNMNKENCNHHKEEKMWYGFRQLPKEVPVVRKKKVFSNVPEGDLYNLNGQIVELKKISGCSNKPNLDEEAIEELMNAAEEDNEEHVEEVKKVSLGEIGYGPAKIKPGVFISIPAAPGLGDAAASAAGSAAAALKPCADGFKPGSAAFTHVPLPSSVQMPIPLPEPCASDEIGIPTLPSGYYSPYTFVSHQSSSQSANKMRQSVMMHKMSCN